MHDKRRVNVNPQSDQSASAPDGPMLQMRLDVNPQPWPIRLRRLLLMSFDCRWNAWVRDLTAKMERR